MKDKAGGYTSGDEEMVIPSVSPGPAPGAMSDDDLAVIRRRWSRNGGMGNDRSDEDYTDAGCRLLLRIAWRDIDTLLNLAEASMLSKGGWPTVARGGWEFAVPTEPAGGQK